MLLMILFRFFCIKVLKSLSLLGLHKLGFTIKHLPIS